MHRLFDRYVKESEARGYSFFTDAGQSIDDILSIVDRGDFAHLVCVDTMGQGDSEYFVGRWYWGRDYAGAPDFEGTLEECLLYVRNWISP